MTKNAYFFIHHGDSSKQILVVVYTNYELIPSIIRCHTCIQGIWPQNPVFETLTEGGVGGCFFWVFWHILAQISYVLRRFFGLTGKTETPPL